MLFPRLLEAESIEMLYFHRFFVDEGFQLYIPDCKFLNCQGLTQPEQTLKFFDFMSGGEWKIPASHTNTGVV